MASTLIIKNVSYFYSLLKIFSQKSKVTIEIDQNSFKISSVDSPCIYLSISNELFEIDVPVEFTISITDLIKNINVIDSNIVLLDQSFRICSNNNGFTNSLNNCNNNTFNNNCDNITNSLNNCNTSGFNDGNNVTNHINNINHITSNIRNDLYSYVDIPFISPIKSYYTNINTFSTKVIIDKICFKNFIKGNLTFHSENNKLIVEKYSVDMNEKLIIDADFLESGYLDFYCSSSWVEYIFDFYDLINTVMLCFSNDILSIKFILKEYSNVYLEIQVLTLLS